MSQLFAPGTGPGNIFGVTVPNPPPTNTNDPSRYTSPTNLLSDDAIQNGQYLTDLMTFDYETVSGQIALPNTDGTGITVVTLHQPMTTKRVFFEKVRLETPPNYPAHNTGDDNSTFLWGKLQVYTPGVMTNMKARIFAVRGLYVYALNTPVMDGQDIPLGQLSIQTNALNTPVTSQTVTQLVMPGTKAVRLF